MIETNQSIISVSSRQNTLQQPHKLLMFSLLCILKIMHIDELIEIIQLTNLADLIRLNGKIQLYIMTLAFLQLFPKQSLYSLQN